jgi:hypothetical protein
MKSIKSKTKGDNATYERRDLNDPIYNLNPSDSGEIQTAGRSARGSE